MGMPFRKAFYDINESGGPAHIIAASISVRGVLFGNSQPAGSRWHSIRSPRIWKIKQSSWHTKNEMLRERHEILETFGSLSLSDVATDFGPAMKWLGSQYLEGSRSATRNQISYAPQWNQFSVGILESERTNSDEASEDEIEDW